MKIREILLEILDLGYLRGPPLHSIKDFSYSCPRWKSIFSGDTPMYKLENSDAEMLPRILAAYYVVALAASLMKHSAVCYRWVKILYYSFQYYFSRSEFDFKKRIPFPHKALREIPLKLLLHKCEREASLREKLYPK